MLVRTSFVAGHVHFRKVFHHLPGSLHMTTYQSGNDKHGLMKLKWTVDDKLISKIFSTDVEFAPAMVPKVCINCGRLPACACMSKVVYQDHYICVYCYEIIKRCCDSKTWTRRINPDDAGIALFGSSLVVLRTETVSLCGGGRRSCKTYRRGALQLSHIDAGQLFDFVTIS